MTGLQIPDLASIGPACLLPFLAATATGVPIVVVRGS
jgi:hypothetical protein